MKRVSSLVVSSLAVVVLASTTSTRAALITGLFNTGVNGGGNVLPIGSREQHYTVTGASTEAFVVPRVFHNPGGYAAWAEAPEGSAWIGPNTTLSTWPTDPVGLYTYNLTISIDLTGYNLSQVRIAGYWATDNSGELWLNGAYMGFNTSDWGFERLSPFLLDHGFRDGLNSLEFKVFNSGISGNPSGLLVAGMHGVDDGSITIPPPIPEPSTVVMGALMVLPVAWAARSKLRGR